MHNSLESKNCASIIGVGLLTLYFLDFDGSVLWPDVDHLAISHCV